ncbi:hypothetical protein TELCIR_09202, partial [Teladorsagia circumcincta]
MNYVEVFAFQCVAKEEEPPDKKKTTKSCEKITEIVTTRTVEKIVTGEEGTSAKTPTPNVCESGASKTAVQPTPKLDDGCKTASQPSPKPDDGCRTASEATPVADDGCKTAREPALIKCVTAKEEGPPGVTTARATSEKTTEIVTKRITEKIVTGEECTSANQPTPKVESADSRTAVQVTPKPDDGCRTASEPTPVPAVSQATSKTTEVKVEDEGCSTARAATPKPETAVQPTPTPCVTAKEEGPPGVTTARARSEKTTEIVTKRTSEKIVTSLKAIHKNCCLQETAVQPTPTPCVTAKEEGPPGVTTARARSEKTTEIVTKRTTEKIVTGEECTSANQPTPKVESADSRTAVQTTPKPVRFLGLDEGCSTARAFTPKPAVSQATSKTTEVKVECITAKEEGPPGVTTARARSEKTTEIMTKRTTEKIVTGEECTSANQPTPKVETADSRTAVQPTPQT